MQLPQSLPPPALEPLALRGAFYEPSVGHEKPPEAVAVGTILADYARPGAAEGVFVEYDSPCVERLS